MTLSGSAEMRVRRRIARLALLPAGATIICAVSGGADSMALLAWLHARREELGLCVEAAHLHHGIAEARSDEAADAVRTFCRTRGIRLHERQVDVAARALTWRVGLEAAGRRVRQGWFRSLARTHEARVATAHTADDQAETVLLRALRGCGTRGIAGIRPHLGRPPWLVRPFLDLRRCETREAARANGLPFVDDPTNDDPRHATRNRVRLALLPLLERDFNPRVVDALCRLAEAAQQDSVVIDRASRRAAQATMSGQRPLVISSRALGLPASLRAAVYRRGLARVGVREVTAPLLERLDDLLRGRSGRRGTVKGVPVRRSAHGLELGSPRLGAAQPLGNEHELPLCGEVRLLGWRIRTWIVDDPGETSPRRRCGIDGYRAAMREPWRSAIALPDGSAALAVRGRKPGDRWRPSKGSGSCKLKATLNAWQVPDRERDAVPLIIADGRIACVAGWGVDAEHCTDALCTPVLQMEFTYIEEQDVHHAG